MLDWPKVLASAGIRPGNVQLFIASPSVEYDEAAILLEEPLDLNIHIAQQIEFLRLAKHWLSEEGSVIYHHNPLPQGVKASIPTYWTDLHLQQLMVWDKLYVDQKHPDWFDRRVDLIWWFVRSPAFYFKKRQRRSNLLRGTWAEILEDMIMSLSQVGDIVVGEVEICEQTERRGYNG